MNVLPEKFANEKQCPLCDCGFLPERNDQVYCVDCEKNPTKTPKNPDVVLSTINVTELQRRIVALEGLVKELLDEFRGVGKPAQTEQKYHKTCSNCKTDFTSDAPATKLCDKCREDS